MCTKMVSSTSAGFFSNEKIGESSLESPHCDRENLWPKPKTTPYEPIFCKLTLDDRSPLTK